LTLEPITKPIRHPAEKTTFLIRNRLLPFRGAAVQWPVFEGMRGLSKEKIDAKDEVAQGDPEAGQSIRSRKDQVQKGQFRAPYERQAGKPAPVFAKTGHSERPDEPTHAPGRRWRVTAGLGDRIVFSDGNRPAMGFRN
jgi:hypothetical protein